MNSSLNRVGDDTATLLEIRDLEKYFPVTKGVMFKRVVGWVKAVDGVSFSIRKGETFGLVGESGCGKTTIGRCILNLERLTRGAIHYAGEDINALDKRDALRYRRNVQAIFQDPFSSLNPRMRARDIIGEPIYLHGKSRDTASIDTRVGNLLDVCGLSSVLAERYPHEMSGGQRQRVGIARALALNPEFIVCD